MSRRRSKKKITPGSDVEQNLKSLMKRRTAGDPDDQQIVFTDLTPSRLEQELDAMKTPASDDIIRQWMDDQKLRLRKIRKVIKRIYETGRNATEEMKERIRSTVCFDKLLPKWNDTLKPQLGQ